MMNRQLPTARPLGLHPGIQSQPAPQLPAIRAASPMVGAALAVGLALITCSFFYGMGSLLPSKSTSEEAAATITASGICLCIAVSVGLMVWAFVQSAGAARQLRTGRIFAGTISAMQAQHSTPDARDVYSNILAWNLQITFFLPERGLSEVRNLTVNRVIGRPLQEGVAVVIVLNQTNTSLAAYRGINGWRAISPFALGKG